MWKLSTKFIIDITGWSWTSVFSDYFRLLFKVRNLRLSKPTGFTSLTSKSATVRLIQEKKNHLGWIPESRRK